MPCGKKPVRKTWDKPRQLQIIKPSRYEQNEASVKVHWRKVMHDMEQSYKDDQFWETQCGAVHDLVGPVIFERIAKIFKLPPQEEPYVNHSAISSISPSESYYVCDDNGPVHMRDGNSMSDITSAEEIHECQEEEDSVWITSSTKSQKRSSKVKSKSNSLFMSKNTMRKYQSLQTLRSASPDQSAHTDDDVYVNASDIAKRQRSNYRHLKNPHFNMLYCNESETDMIKWKSKYKQKVYEVSASDEFSKKAEIITKMISQEFFDWWTSLGSVEFKSEIRRPEDIEALFQVWFEEHASQGLVLDPKIIPCVLKNIAVFIGVPKASCPNVLKRQIAFDILAETSPAKTTAFNSSLPHKMKHIPPNNNTKKLWHSVKIPQDLKSMACVWEDVQHLTSTKAFQRWLEKRPHLPMPMFLKALGAEKDNKPLFLIPSDYMVKDKNSTSIQDLALPVSQFSMELMEVLSQLMNH